MHSVESALKELYTSATTGNVNTADYYEEMGRVLAPLEPCTSADVYTLDKYLVPETILEPSTSAFHVSALAPLPELTFDDVLDGVFDDLQYGGGMTTPYLDMADTSFEECLDDDFLHWLDLNTEGGLNVNGGPPLASDHQDIGTTSDYIGDS